MLSYISELAKEAMYTLSSESEELSLFYESDIEGDIDSYEEAKEKYTAIFLDNIEKEKIVGVSLYGVQRDDIDIKINGKDAKTFASQGQTRSVVLALKIAEGGIIKKMSGEEPVYLFDDVMSELDGKRKKVIFENLLGKQLIITSCERDNEQLCESFYEVKAGKYVSTHR
jgi:DNA replication and repair protein RecF